LILLLLFVLAALLHERIQFASALPFAGALVLGALRLRRFLPALMNATRVSPATSVALLGLFLVALVPGGHGVAPIAMFLIAGWRRFLVETALASLAIGCLGAGVVLRGRFASMLSMTGSVMAAVAWALLEAGSDDPLAGTLGSLPFLGCLVLHVIHLCSLRPSARHAGG
jgi:hypothetical protein